MGCKLHRLHSSCYSLELRKLDLHWVYILQLISVAQVDIGGDLDDRPWVMSRALFVLVRA